MNYTDLPTITRRQHRYVGNNLVGCASLMMRLAVTGMGIAIAAIALAALLAK